jgi:hypothetical protein
VVKRELDMDSIFLRNILNELIMAKEAVEVSIENHRVSSYPIIDDLENIDEHLEKAIDNLSIRMGIVRGE